MSALIFSQTQKESSQKESPSLFNLDPATNNVRPSTSESRSLSVDEYNSSAMQSGAEAADNNIQIAGEKRYAQENNETIDASNSNVRKKNPKKMIDATNVYAVEILILLLILIAILFYLKKIYTSNIEERIPRVKKFIASYLSYPISSKELQITTVNKLNSIKNLDSRKLFKMLLIVFCIHMAFLSTKTYVESFGNTIRKMSEIEYITLLGRKDKTFQFTLKNTEIQYLYFLPEKSILVIYFIYLAIIIPLGFKIIDKNKLLI